MNATPPGSEAWRGCWQNFLVFDESWVQKCGRAFRKWYTSWAQGSGRRADTHFEDREMEAKILGILCLSQAFKSGGKRNISIYVLSAQREWGAEMWPEDQTGLAYSGHLAQAGGMQAFVPPRPLPCLLSIAWGDVTVEAPLSPWRPGENYFSFKNCK